MTTDKIICGDAFEVLKTLPGGSVHCCITSPPYWGLRSYLSDNHPCKQLEIGTEEMPEEYVAKLVEVFREVRRVLRDDGTLWLVLGDSYVGGGRAGNEGIQKWGGIESGNQNRHYGNPTGKISGLKPKDLVGIPWRVAFALQADGWWLRKDIIWAKPNPMPESVTDRPTSSHEYIFLLSKSARYYYDQDAIKEPCNWPEGSWGRSKCYDGDTTGKLRSFYGNGAQWKGGEKRNKRDVWRVATQPFPDAHYAVYPLELIRPCILAGTSAEGCCPECGAPWERIIKRTKVETTRGHEPCKQARGGTSGNPDRDIPGGWVPQVATIGWQPTCSCNAGNPIPCIVFDPFMGAGTTGLVARQEGRHYLGIELDPEWAKKAQKRIYKECPMDRLI